MCNLLVNKCAALPEHLYGEPACRLQYGTAHNNKPGSGDGAFGKKVGVPFCNTATAEKSKSYNGSITDHSWFQQTVVAPAPPSLCSDGRLVLYAFDVGVNHFADQLLEADLRRPAERLARLA